jgi:hypothetical protein
MMRRRQAMSALALLQAGEKKVTLAASASLAGHKRKTMLPRATFVILKKAKN